MLSVHNLTVLCRYTGSSRNNAEIAKNKSSSYYLAKKYGQSYLANQYKAGMYRKSNSITKGVINASKLVPSTSGSQPLKSKE